MATFIAQYAEEVGTDVLHGWYVVIDTSHARDQPSEAEVQEWLQSHSAIEAFLDGDDSPAGAEAEARRLGAVSPDGWIIDLAKPIIADGS